MIADDPSLFYSAQYSACAPLLGWDNTLYFGSCDGYFYAIASSGAVKWKFKTGGPISGSPAMSASGYLYVGSDDGNIYCLDSTGKQRWATKLTASTCAPAVAPDGTIYVLGGQALFALTAQGTSKWTLPVGLTGVSPAIGQQGDVFVYGQSIGVGMVAPDGVTKWSAAGWGAGNAWPAFSVDGQDNVLFSRQCVQWSTGDFLWDTWPSNASPTAIDASGNLYGSSYSNGRTSLAVFASGGSPLWSLQLTPVVDGLYGPIVGKDHVYIFSTGGRLFAVK